MSDPREISAVPADEGFGYQHCGARLGSARWCDICDDDRPRCAGTRT